MNDVKSLWVVWQNPKTRSYYHIGTLSYFDNHYEFSYTSAQKEYWKLNDALKDEYMLHPAFPDPNKTYKSKELFNAFDRRLPSPIRADFSIIMEELGLDKNHSKMEILEETRGRLANDTYSFERPLRVESDGNVHTSFFIHGMRYQKLPKNWPQLLKTIKTVTLVQEPENSYDPNAVAIYTETGVKLGYIPGFYSKGVFALLENGASPIVTISKVNEISTPHWWVKLNYVSEIPSGNKRIPEFLAFVETAV
ncbi:HIRAN domain-containing protein [Virgibacillus byunsanensis]|uniref:HIRAN domain-containing protein n=1 Tax=Virgibacillus byunsanensis TaxID=570945 RepID=A0ABW3LS17_9BACI